jgi:hypothetical protein
MSLNLLLGGGLLAAIAGNQANKANLQANRQNIAAQAANQEKAINALQFTSPTESLTRDPSTGGFIGKDLGEQAIRREGDFGRALKVNEAGRDFRFDIPDFSTAGDLIQGDISADQGRFDKAMGDIGLLKKRQFGGLQNTGETGNTIDALSRFAGANRLNKTQRTVDLLGSSQQNNNAILAQIIANNQAQAPRITGPGNVAATQIVQSPPPAVTPNFGLGALLPAAGANVLSQLNTQQAQKDRDEAFVRALRANQGSI